VAGDKDQPEPAFPTSPVDEPQGAAVSVAAGSALLFGAQLLSNLGYFAAVLLLARGLSPAERGTVAFLTITALVVSRLVRVGVADATTVFAAQRPPQRPALFSNLFLFTLGAMLLGAGAVSAVILAFGLHPAGITYWQLVPLAAGIVASGFVDAGSAYLLGLGRVAQLAGLNAVGPWLYALLVGIVTAVSGLTATRAMIAWAVGHGLWATILIVACRRHTRPSRVDRALLSESVAFGLRAWIGGLSRFLNFRLDQILMGFIASEAALGVYAVAVNASEILLILPGAAAAAILPILARSRGSEQLERTLRILRAVTLLTTATVVVAAILGSALIPLVFGSKYDGSKTPFVLLVPGAIGFAIMAILSSALVAASAPGRSSLGPVAALVSGLVLDVILIPPYGASGAAIAATGGFAFGALASLFAFRSLFPFPWSALVPARADLRALLALAPRGLLQPRGSR
jgi:O-antigen/teichoic acid export membrane protein